MFSARDVISASMWSPPPMEEAVTDAETDGHAQGNDKNFHDEPLARLLKTCWVPHMTFLNVRGTPQARGLYS